MVARLDQAGELEERHGKGRASRALAVERTHREPVGVLNAFLFVRANVVQQPVARLFADADPQERDAAVVVTLLERRLKLLRRLQPSVDSVEEHAEADAVVHQELVELRAVHVGHASLEERAIGTCRCALNPHARVTQTAAESETGHVAELVEHDAPDQLARARPAQLRRARRRDRKERELIREGRGGGTRRQDPRGGAVRLAAECVVRFDHRGEGRRRLGLADAREKGEGGEEKKSERAMHAARLSTERSSPSEPTRAPKGASKVAARSVIRRPIPIAPLPMMPSSRLTRRSARRPAGSRPARSSPRWPRGLRRARAP